MEQLLYKFTLITLIFVQINFGKYVNFKFGCEYEYRFHLETSVKDLGQFVIDAKVNFS